MFPEETENQGQGYGDPRGAVLEQVVREGYAKEVAFGRGLKGVGESKASPWGMLLACREP